MIISKIHKVLMMVVIVIVLSACGKVSEESYEIDATDEMAQQIGDAMASLDEGGGSNAGQLAKIDVTGYEKSFARLAGSQDFISRMAQKDFSEVTQDLSALLISKSYAVDCSAVTFSGCAGGALVRDFSNGCSLADHRPQIARIGTATGYVRLTYAGTGAGTCTIPAITGTDSVTRIPNYRITGLRGAIFDVSAISTGQKITRIGQAAFTYENAGIRRQFTTGSGEQVLDMTIKTSSTIAITGKLRHNRSLSGGGMTITNNLTGLACTVSPSNNVTWTTGCNCPSSGSWSGTCTDTQTLTVTFSGTCGETTLTKGSVIKAVTMDRCQP